MKFITDVRPGETDVLAGFEMQPLQIRDMEGKTVHTVQPTEPWTTESMYAAVGVPEVRAAILEAGATDAFLGESHWIGSTEI